MKTVGDALKTLFPSRDVDPPYLAFWSESATASDLCDRPPLLPFDVFAIAGHLLSLSGAYHHVAPFGQTRAACLLEISATQIAEARDVAQAWRAFEWTRYTKPGSARVFRRWLREPKGQALAKLFEWWRALFVDHADAKIFVDIDRDTQAPDWWHIALMLFITADEAAAEVGFNALNWDAEHGDDPAPWFERFAYVLFFVMGNAVAFDADGSAETKAFSTLSAADKNILCVLPKARTPSVGCTMRSMSHNLALMPPQGVATGRWMPFSFEAAPPDERHMNLLLVPFPFTVPASAFRPKTEDFVTGQRSSFFCVDQKWLEHVTPQKMTDFVLALAQEACREVDRVHAVVFPELALNEAFYQYLVAELPRRLPGIELLVAGVSDADGRHGNFVNATVFQTRRERGIPKTTAGIGSKRGKHHRWKLDRSQILAYGLEGVLSPSLQWWEDIDLLNRRVDFAVIRAGSVVSALICEDLARVDPCQDLIRAVGPSIIFALLMDAPQLKARWPARHATILAEDPGSAVLTLTSKAMMARQDRLKIHESTNPEDRVVALWRDDGTAVPEELSCPNGCFGVILTLSGNCVTDESLDGRRNDKAIAWRYAGHRALPLRTAETDFSDVIGRDGQSSSTGPVTLSR